MSAKDTTPDRGVLNAIKDIVGPKGFVEDPSLMHPFLTSWRNGWTGQSSLIVFPATTHQVSSVITLCHLHNISVVPQGGNTGLVGGCIPSPNGHEIVVNMSRMTAIRDLDPIGSTITVEAGVILQDLQESAAKAGLLFPLSMASEGSAHIGGAVSTNAGGTAVLRYGNIRNLMMGVEVVLANGQILSSLNRLAKDNAGYNLSQYFVGAEGTLGIVTATTLKVFPALKQNIVALLALPGIDAALTLLANFRNECGEYLCAFEIMSREALDLVIKHLPNSRLPFKQTTAAYYLLIELGSTSQAAPLRSLFETTAHAKIETGDILDAVIAENIAQAKNFWGLRENISESLRKEGAGLHFDISLPLSQIVSFLKNTEIKIRTIVPGIYLAPFGHVGDGNIHYNMCFAGSYDPPNPHLKKQIKDLVYDEVHACQGSISAEHGIGVERRAELAQYKSPLEMEIMRKIKKALDPDNIMNPGKIFLGDPCR